MSTLTDDERDRERRALYDEDDRVRCACVHYRIDGPEYGYRDQCTNLTRHPSGKCVDCRHRS